jgi:hypothetical protein
MKSWVNASKDKNWKAYISHRIPPIGHGFGLAVIVSG